MHKNPVFVIIVPVLNRATLLPRCLQSIEAQSYRPLQVIVVDNGSTDASLAVARKWAETVRAEDLQVEVISEPRPGASIARNAGLTRAAGPYCSFVDSDDVVLPDMAARAVEQLQAGADLAYWRVEICSPEGSVRQKTFTRRASLPFHLVHAFLCTLAYAVRVDFIRKAGAWDEDLLQWDDWELGCRLLAHQPQTRCIDAVLSRAYEQTLSITGTDFASKHGMWERAIDRAERALKEDEKALKLLTYRRAVLAAHYAREKEPELARNLLTLALDKGYLPAWMVKAIYHYTRLGGRGAYLLTGIKP